MNVGGNGHAPNTCLQDQRHTVECGLPQGMPAFMITHLAGVFAQRTHPTDMPYSLRWSSSIRLPFMRSALSCFAVYDLALLFCAACAGVSVLLK